MANRHVQHIFLIGYGIQDDAFFKSSGIASIMWNKWFCPVDNIKARENVCVVYIV